ncbi:hypothetical protein [Rugamonas fusca]|uniref:hypothetical protein n=1 Tax=Rugamonas fusca TaxID=2758568 RepID=UPI001E656769|nr:hypothetical protein [Rugamonas fusca]
MHQPDLVAPAPQPPVMPATGQVAGSGPQRWQVRITDGKFHWYDLLAGFPDKPDFREPIGRYLRRMQFDLEAANERPLLYCVVTRPRMRYDPSRATQWGFFSLKLTVPLLSGAHATRDSVTVELKPPFGATVKKPSVILTENFLNLNWGGVIEVLSVHDLLMQYVHDRKLASQVLHVGQTLDPEGRLAKGRLPAVQRLRQQHSEHSDTLVLVLQPEITASSPDGDPADLAGNQIPDVAAALARIRMDVLEAALICYFEGPTPAGRYGEEKERRRNRLQEVQQAWELDTLEVAVELEAGGSYRYLASEHVAVARRHLFRCKLADGCVSVAKLPQPPTA